MSDRDNEFGAYFIGILIGGLAGAAAALLLAPQSGEQTRTYIRDKSIELKDKAVVSADEARKYAEEAMDEAKSRAETAMEETRAWANELSKMSQDMAADIQRRGQVILEEQKTKLDSLKSKGKAVSSETPASEG